MSARPPAVFHIGMAKCASTFIQDEGRARGAEGAVQALMWAPWDAMLNGAAARGGMPIAPFPRARPAKLDLARGTPVFASNECLTGVIPLPLRFDDGTACDASVVRRFQECAADDLKAMTDRLSAEFEPRIILIVREPRAWLKSAYKNFVLMGMSASPEDCFARFGEALCAWTDIDALVALYRARFGAEAITVIPFELLSARPAAFAATFNRIAGVDLLRADAPKRNVGLSDAATESIRLIWETTDRIAPPEPAWSDPAIHFKDQAWRFLHESVLNHEGRVREANAMATNEFKYDVPEKYVILARSKMSSLKEFNLFDEFLNLYDLK